MGRRYERERDLYSNSKEIGSMQEVLGSNISRNTGYPHSYFLCNPQTLQENIRKVLQLCPDSFHPIRHSLIILQFD